MATTNFSSIQLLSFIRLFSSVPQNTPTLFLNSHPNPSLNLRALSPNPKPYHSSNRPRPSPPLLLAVKNLGDTDPLTVSLENGEIAGDFPSAAGVYAVYGKDGELQFIGLSRNIAASVSTHWKSVPELCGSVKFGVVDEPDRANLTEAWKSWMEEYIKVSGKVPPGNESGNATWVRQPPKKKADLRLTPGRHTQLTVPLEELIDKLVKENKVVAFIKGSRSAPMCGFSQRVIGILENVGVDYESVDVLDENYNYGLRETLKQYSNWPTFPQIFVNGELVGGCDILTSMYEKGELATLFKK
ncbi:Bifunctional monothiol glutaredoxin-S16, chloroplastic [Stylosanthes scabra]|uniref:Bifunctional monothiol glutaredoxin-S16, chloroplastic n=1 Tax=Stylosanthes scabra TaxID=79078 RepID=A0ABU6XS20_9FABA|nr:Bifunctional monothiol glutaredoxin-S16, chloroplastic [Stylosanthes scabra]